MKKLIIILFISLFINGCYDYNELNNLAVVTAIGIDYVDDEFEVTLEMLDTKKKGEDSNATESYTKTNKGVSLVEALDGISNSLDKIIYYGHLDVVVIDEEIAKNYLDVVSDHLVRCPRLRNEFYTIIIKNDSAKNVLNNTSEKNPVVSTYIKDLLEDSKESSNTAYYTPFTETLNSILSDGKDTAMSIFELDDEDLKLVGMGLFQNFKLKRMIDNNDARIINLLNNFDVRDITFSNSCKENNYTTISIYNGKVDLKSNQEKIVAKATLQGWIKEDNCGYDLMSEDAYKTLQKKFTENIKKEIIDVIEETKLAKSNVLNLGKSYYISTRKKNYFAWLTQDIEVQIDLKINKKGLTFEIKER